MADTLQQFIVLPEGWYCVFNSQAHGPFDEQKLLDLISSGVLTTDTLVWNAEMRNTEEGWQKASTTEIATLFHLKQMRKWFCYINNQTFGPYAEKQIKYMFQEGQITHDTLVWCDGFADSGWMRVKETELVTSPETYQETTENEIWENIFKINNHLNENSEMSPYQKTPTLITEPRFVNSYNNNATQNNPTAVVSLSWGSFIGILLIIIVAVFLLPAIAKSTKASYIENDYMQSIIDGDWGRVQELQGKYGKNLEKIDGGCNSGIPAHFMVMSVMILISKIKIGRIFCSRTLFTCKRQNNEP
jgi:hypothetical protein